MKKLILTCVTIAFMSTVSYAQTFNLGLKGGVNLAKINSDFADAENRLGYQIGAWARIGGSGIYLQPELYFGSKENKFVEINTNGTTVTTEGTVKFTTMDVPVLIGKKFGANNFNFRLNAGPVISFNLDKSTSNFSNAFQQLGDTKNYKDQTFGAQFGAGVDISNFTVDLRYETGLSNIYTSDQYKQKLNTFLVSVGFKIF